MLNDLFLNVCVLTTMTFLASLTFRAEGRDSLVWQGLRYLIAVAASCLLIRYAISPAPGVLVDLRLVPLALVALYYGPVAGLAVAVPIAAYRYWLGGDGVWPAMLGLLLVLSVCGLLRRSDTAYFRHFRQVWWYPVVIFGVAGLTSLLIPDVGWTVFRETYVGLFLEQSVAFVLGLWVLRTRFKSIARVEHFRDLVFSDALTGLFNRRQFDDDLAELSHDNTSFLLLLDLDHFKRVNDARGHAFGDLVLASCARLLQENVRVNDRVYRFGGEEFAVVLHRCSAVQAQRVAERVRVAVEQQLGRMVGERELPLTVSAGLVELHADRVKAEVLEADTLLYAAKEAGRNRVMTAA